MNADQQLTFDLVASAYDAEFTHTAIGRLQRDRVYHHLRKSLSARSLRILEINCGSGEDAVWLAKQGHEVMATDASPKMIAQVSEKAAVTVHEMLDELVFVLEGEHVAMRSMPNVYAPVRAMMELYRSNETTHEVMTAKGLKEKTEPTFDLWRTSPMRLSVHRTTFDPGRSRMFSEPQADGQELRYLNMWREPHHPEEQTTPEQRDRLLAPVLAHIAHLIPDAALYERFLDYLAHMAQKPEELPSTAWLFIALKHGSGRGMLFKFLRNVWGNDLFQLGLNMTQVLTDKFNDEISCKVGLEVSEINEGTQQGMHKLEEALKTFIDAPTRKINLKYGRKHVEMNVARLFICSNHLTALPVSKEDRRLIVVMCGAPKDEAYYVQLGAAMEDPRTAASFWHYLRQRDIRRFNPKATAPMTEAKRELIENSKANGVSRAEEAIRTWPRAVILTRDLLAEVYGDDGGSGKEGALVHVAHRAGIVKWRGTKSGRLRVNGAQETVWVLRDAERWVTADTHDVVAELHRAAPALGPTVPFVQPVQARAGGSTNPIGQ